METNVKYFGYLSDQIAKLLNEVLDFPTRNMFRRGPEIKVGLPSAGSDSFHLFILSKEEKGTDGGNFYFPHGENVLMFREPIQMTTTFALYATEVAADYKMAALDSLTSYFFDHRSVPAILPPEYTSFAPLQSRLSLRKAELTALPDQVFVNPDQKPFSSDFIFRFQYSALYHSGNPLRETPKVQQRVISYGENNQSSAQG